MVAGNSEMDAKPDVKLSFTDWLAKVNYKKFNSQQLISALEDASNYAVERKLSKVPFSCITDPAQFTSVMGKVQGMRFFRIMHPRTSRYLDSASTLYRRYLLSLRDSEPVVPPRTEDSPVLEKNQRIPLPLCRQTNLSRKSSKLDRDTVSFLLET